MNIGGWEQKKRVASSCRCDFLTRREVGDSRYLYSSAKSRLRDSTLVEPSLLTETQTSLHSLTCYHFDGTMLAVAWASVNFEQRRA